MISFMSYWKKNQVVDPWVDTLRYFFGVQILIDGIHI